METNETTTRAQEITEETLTAMRAAEGWQDLADSKARFAQAMGLWDEEASKEAAKQSLQAANVARSLRMQIQTGIIHCSCRTPPHPLT